MKKPFHNKRIEAITGWIFPHQAAKIARRPESQSLKWHVQDADVSWNSGIESGADMVINVDKPFQLLITDDNSAFRQVLRDALELASTNVEVVEQSHETASHRGPILEVFEAESGEEAVEIVRKQRIDIVLLDMHMHIMSGLETLHSDHIRYQRADLSRSSGSQRILCSEEARPAQATGSNRLNRSGVRIP